MKKLVILIGLAFLTSCASYRAIPLSTLEGESVCSRPKRTSGIKIVAKAFDKQDCKKFLDRNVIHQGYLPVQLYIENKSDRNYLFSLDKVSLPCVPHDEVAGKVHTSTLARTTGYGAAALICWPFAIPAVIDGVSSLQANEALDNDFLSKAAKDQVITPHSQANMVLFVPVKSYQSVFNITLIDLISNQPLNFVIQAAR